MTYGSIVSSLWFWLAVAFITAAVIYGLLIMWGLLRMASRQSREEEAAEYERRKEWEEKKRQVALARLREELQQRRKERA